MHRRAAGLVRAAAAPAVVGRPTQLGAVTFVGEQYVGHMAAEDYAVVRHELGDMPPGIAGWDIQHEWGRPWVDAVFSEFGMDIRVRRFMKAARIGHTRGHDVAARRAMGIHARPDTWSMEPRGEDDAEHVAVYLTNSAGWTMAVSAWLVEEVLVLRDIVVHPCPRDPLALETDPARELRYRGPALTDFDTVWALFGGRGYAWDPEAEPLEGWVAADNRAAIEDADIEAASREADEASETGNYRRRRAHRRGRPERGEPAPPEAGEDDTDATYAFNDSYHNRSSDHALNKHAEDTITRPLGEEYGKVPEADAPLDPDEERAIQLGHAKAALKRSVYRSLDQGHIIAQRQQRTVAPPPKPAAFRYRKSTAVPHEAFVKLSPHATTVMYNFFDALGVNDPNLTRLSDITQYVKAMEAARQMHGVMAVLSQA